mgnify:CR=1 FL=1
MIRILFMDIDGTLTDGKIYIGFSGEVMKAFDVKDGYAIHDLLPKHNIVPVIVTGRTSVIVENRAKELGIQELYQGIHDKTKILNQIIEKYKVSFEEVAYIGDDYMDLPCMKRCAISGCPSDAVKEVKDICDYVCQNKGGNGAVREFIEWLIQQKKELS